MDSALDCYTDERVELCRGLAFVGVNLRTRILGWMDAKMQHRSAEPNNLSFFCYTVQVRMDFGVLGPLSNPGIGADRPFASGRTLNVYV